MKKFLAILMAATLAMSMSTAALAAEDPSGDDPVVIDPAGEEPAGEEPAATGNGHSGYADGSETYGDFMRADVTNNITITKGYTINGKDNESDKHPADTVTFAVNKSEYSFNGVEDTSVTPPELVINSPLTITEGTDKLNIPITLPVYNLVGVYTYHILETGSKTAGVTYTYDTNATRLVLKVTVINELDNGVPTGNLLIGGIALRDGDATSGKKLGNAEGDLENVHNDYEKGQLTVSKTVSGNAADTTKEWHFEVTFTADSGETVKSTIHYEGTGKLSETASEDESTTNEGENATNDDESTTGTGDSDDIAFGEGWTKKTVYVTLVHGKDMVFTNIPEGVSYTVTEVEANKDGYTTTPTGNDGKIAKEAEVTASFVNSKTDTPDTGIVLDSMPYMMIMMMVMAGASMMLYRRREEF